MVLTLQNEVNELSTKRKLTYRRILHKSQHQRSSNTIKIMAEGTDGPGAQCGREHGHSRALPLKLLFLPKPTSLSLAEHISLEPERGVDKVNQKDFWSSDPGLASSPRNVVRDPPPTITPTLSAGDPSQRSSDFKPHIPPTLQSLLKSDEAEPGQVRCGYYTPPPHPPQ